MDMYDATDPANIPAGAPSVMFYDDAAYDWDPETVTAWAAKVPCVGISALGLQSSPVYDFERGNAGMEVVATDCVLRLGQGLWSVIYCEGDSISEVVSGLRTKGLGLTPASSWPAPGVYLHAADPTGVPHLSVAWAPVQPVAVQDRWTSGYDVSSTYGGYPGPVGIATGDPIYTTGADMTDEQASQLAQIFNALPLFTAQVAAMWQWGADVVPIMGSLPATLTALQDGIVAAVLAALPAGGTGGLSAAQVTDAVKAAFAPTTVPGVQLVLPAAAVQA